MNEIIFKILDQLKPEVKEMAIFFLSNEDKPDRFADCNFLFKPPLIKIYSKSVEKRMDNFIKEVISHELIHAIQTPFQPLKEKEAYDKQKKVNFFI